MSKQKHNSTNLAFYLFALLLTLIPFHAFLVTFLNALFFDSATSAPLFLRMWKEGVIALLAGVFVYQLIRTWKKPRLILLDYAVLAYVFLGVLSAVFITKNPKIALYGAKYDFEFLVLYLIVRQFTFSKQQIQTLLKIVLTTASIVIVFGLMQKLLLPESFLTLFGYSTDHSHFSPNKPLAYCQKVSGTDSCRVQSFLSGPNQFGSYLLIVLPLFFASLWQALFAPKTENFWQKIRRKTRDLIEKLPFQSYLPFSASQTEQELSWHVKLRQKENLTNLVFFCLGFLVLLVSYSRSAWLGFAAMFALACVLLISNKRVLGYGISGLIIGGILTVMAFQIFAPTYFHNVLFRPSSTQGHSERMADGIKFTLENPLGLGLGNAGPASNHFAQDYLGFVPESWYLQVSLELGILGILLYLTLMGIALYTLYKRFKSGNSLALALLLSLAGMLVATQFLHSWEDSATALTFWGLAGLALIQNKRSPF